MNYIGSKLSLLEFFKNSINKVVERKNAMFFVIYLLILELLGIISKANVKYIFLSYNNEGIMNLEDIKEIMSLRGKYGYFTKNYSRFKSDKNRVYKADKTVEYLHYVECE